MTTTTTATGIFGFTHEELERIVYACQFNLKIDYWQNYTDLAWKVAVFEDKGSIPDNDLAQRVALLSTNQKFAFAYLIKEFWNRRHGAYSLPISDSRIQMEEVGLM